jgi:hypothetical protein
LKLSALPIQQQQQLIILRKHNVPPFSMANNWRAADTAGR